MSGDIEIPEEYGSIDEWLAKDEAQLYLKLGESLPADIAPTPPSSDPQHGFMKSEDLIVWRAKIIDASIERGKKFFEKNRAKLHTKICVEMNACNFEKEMEKDSNQLLRTLIPVVGPTIGLTIPATVITITLILMKMSIKSFCNCPEDD